MSIELVMLSNHLILCHPLLHLLSVFLSIRVLFNELILHIRWPKYQSFSFSSSPSNEYSGWISFRIAWIWSTCSPKDSQEALRYSIWKYHNLKASVLQHSAYFMVQISHPYMTTGQTITLTRQTFVGKVISLLFFFLKDPNFFFF